MNIVLFEPEIPQNTGNVARTCVVTGTKLHLIEPMGFSVSDKWVKRAGLDYWSLLDLEIHENFQTFVDKYGKHPFYLLTTKGQKVYSQISFEQDAFLIFGKESAGFPKEIHDAYEDRRFRIPMANHEKARSLNLSNSVSVVLYEALRQQGFPDLL